MSTAYQYDADGFFAGTIEDHGILPNNATHMKPLAKKGHIPRWNGKTWDQAEDHRERRGMAFLPDQDATAYWLPEDNWDAPARGMTQPGPLPEGALRKAPQKTPEQALACFNDAFAASVQGRLDAFAREKGYADILAAASYAASANPAYAAEGRRALDLRDATWLAATALLREVQSGKRPVPEVENALNELPALTWTA